MSSLLDLLPQREAFKHKTDTEWAGPCPWCGGTDRFVVVTDGGQDGKGRYFCRQCDAKGFASDFLEKFRHLSRQEAREALGLPDGKPSPRQPDKAAAKPEVLMPVPEEAPRPQLRHPRHGQPAAHWEYRDTAGRLLGCVCRFSLDETDQRGKARKEFCPRVYTTSGWRWQGFPTPRPLYGLHKLAENAAPSLILLTEGEAKADALQSVLGPNVAVLGLHGGCAGVWKLDFTPLAGRRFVYWPDADAPGAGAALSVAETAGRAGAAGVRIVVPPTGVRETWDAADAVKEGWDSDQLSALIQAAVSPAEFGKVAADRWGVRQAVEATRKEGDACPVPEKGNKYRCLNIEELITRDYPPREMILAPVLAVQSLSMIFAMRGVGKTFFALSCAYAVASGGGVFGRWFAPRPARVLYIDGEMPAVTLQERLKSIAISADSDITDPDMLRILTPDEQDGPMPNLGTREGQEAVEPFLDDVALVVVDNLATLARTGKENDSDSWVPVQEWLLALRRRGISVLLVHHAGKNGSQRGTGAKEDILDTVIELKRPSDYRAEQGARFEVHFTKARGLYGEDTEPFEAMLSIDEQGQCSWTTRKVADLVEQRVLELLEAGCSEREIAEELKDDHVGRTRIRRIRQFFEAQGKSFPRSRGGAGTHRKKE